MADYYPLLSKAVASLDPNTPEARQGVYERARAALQRQLASIEPAVAPAIVERELQALAEVARRIEAEQSGTAAPEPIAAPEPKKPAQARPQVVRREPAARRRPWMAPAAAVGLMVVMAVATLAFLRRNDPPAVVSRPPPQQQQAAAPSAAAPKTEDRVGTGSAESPAPAPATARPSEVPTSTAPAAPQPAPVSVANRMVLILEGKEDPQKVEARHGSVVWRTEMVSGGQGQALQQAIKAIIDVPDARMRTEITIQRNRDPAFPASHTLQVQFSSVGASEVGPIRSLSQIEFRQSENQPGYALAGQGIAVMQDLFLVALAQIEPAQSRNVEMMRTRPLIYLEFQSAAGRRGAMIIEKGVSGQQAFDDAFRNWQ